MKKILICIICSLLSIPSFAQIVKQGEKFKTVPLYEGKVTFIKEIPIKPHLSIDDNYKILKSWAGTHYGKDPFVSTISYRNKKHRFVAKSRIELLLPPNSKGVRERMSMRYRIKGLFYQNKCILEITDITYVYESGQNSLLSRTTIMAEDFITKDALSPNDGFIELKTNTRKSTLYFFNELAANLEDQFRD
ncbi:DUF4468 domain-containing protein [Dysgonomonas sp. 521]|uniref:DUF4468 domain-containing protein n=1 Tax=Dysgonomonas sp. 521 TaxID=2302932 RepID=UPI0013D6827F|nr:DUF4468 domain-containing protein [Dysgonomonas sp. 521]NDV93683.1 DUF4468 domain-containing protein [Dysgonomonas sp. 521]